MEASTSTIIDNSLLFKPPTSTCPLQPMVAARRVKVKGTDGDDLIADGRKDKLIGGDGADSSTSPEKNHSRRRPSTRSSTSTQARVTPSLLLMRWLVTLKIPLLPCRHEKGSKAAV